MLRCFRFIATLLWVGTPAVADEPTVAEFQAHLTTLTAKSTANERLAVAIWLRQQATSKHAAVAIPTLEKLIHKDPDAKVRRESVAALMSLVNSHNVDCPVGLMVALRDPVDDVRWQATVLVGPYKKRLAPGALDALIAACGDERIDVRSNCLLLLGHAAGKEAKARATIDKAKSDQSFEVRHSAHIAWFTATGDLAEHLAYIIRVREEPDMVLKPVPTDAEKAKADRTMRNLCAIGGAIRVAEWSNDQPDELAKALLKLLDDKSAAIRRGAADLIGASARKVELKHSDPLADFQAGKSAFESFGKLIDPNYKPPKGQSKTPLPSKAFTRLLEHKAPARLRYVSTMDPDATVRAAARLALKRLAELPEPLSIPPREVKGGE